MLAVALHKAIMLIVNLLSSTLTYNASLVPQYLNRRRGQLTFKACSYILHDNSIEST